jgi:hypothetical protein
MGGARRARRPSSLVAAYSVPRIDDHAGGREKLVRPPKMESIEKCKVL